MIKYATLTAPALMAQLQGQTVIDSMRNAYKLALTSSLLLATPLVFACEYPEQVTIPNGNTATEQEMLEGQNGVKQYVADMEAYLDCIVAEEKAARAAIEDLEPEEEQQREDLLTKKYNAAVEEMETVAARFNTQVQAFKNRDE
jgi:hypothetical protein